MQNVLQTSKYTVSMNTMFIMYGSGYTRLRYQYGLCAKCAANFKICCQCEYNVYFARMLTNLVDIVMQHHKSHADKVVHCIQCQGHSKGLSNQNTTTSVVSSKLHAVCNQT